MFKIPKISREKVIEQLQLELKNKKIEPDDQIGRELASIYLNSIIVNQNEEFSRRDLEHLKRGVKKWSKGYLKKMEHTNQVFQPLSTGTTSNITSLPREWKKETFFSTEVKEEVPDTQDKAALQHNLRLIAKADDQQDLIAGHAMIPYKLVASMEQLARGYAYHAPQEGEIIDIFSSQTGALERFKVEIIPLKGGIYAFGLKAENANVPSILLFRGTSFYPSGRGAGQTIATDLHPLGIGYDTYMKGKEAIKDWIEKNSSEDKKVFITGHSLGSALASYAAIDNAEHVGAAFCFGATKISFLFHHAWQRVKDQLLLVNFNAPGDKLADFGHIRVGTATFVGTYAATLPKEEVIGKVEGKPPRGRVVKRLNQVRPKTTAHRIAYLDKGARLWQRKHEPATNWFKVAAQVALFAPAYLVVSAGLVIKRGLFGYSGKKGIFS